MSETMRGPVYFAIMAALLMIVGFAQSWNLALAIVNLCLISSIMALGVNMQWGYAGLFNVGTMGFAAIGGVAAVLVSMPPVAEAWGAGGGGLALSLLSVVAAVVAIVVIRRKMAPGRGRSWLTAGVVLVGYYFARFFSKCGRPKRRISTGHRSKGGSPFATHSASAIPAPPPAAMP